MAEHIWTVLCERHLTDPETEIISLIDVAENFTIENLEQQLEEAKRQGKKGALVNARAQLVSWWYHSEPEEAALQARFVLTGPTGEAIFTQPVNAPWEEGNVFRRIFVNLKRIPVRTTGLHWFVVEQQRTTEDHLHWVIVAKIPLQIDAA
jgi:hypothetical protein